MRSVKLIAKKKQKKVKKFFIYMLDKPTLGAVKGVS